MIQEIHVSECVKICFFPTKIRICLERGNSQTHPQWGGDTPSPRPPPRRLRHIGPSHSKILGTPLHTTGRINAVQAQQRFRTKVKCNACCQCQKVLENRNVFGDLQLPFRAVFECTATWLHRLRIVPETSEPRERRIDPRVFSGVHITAPCRHQAVMLIAPRSAKLTSSVVIVTANTDCLGQ